MRTNKYEIDQIMMVIKDYPDGSDLMKGAKVTISNDLWANISLYRVIDEDSQSWGIKGEDIIPYPKSAEEILEDLNINAETLGDLKGNQYLIKSFIIMAMEKYASQFK